MAEQNPEIEKYRPTKFPVNALIYNRWSPRSMSGEPLKDEELMPLFEAARLAPSSYNGQPWTFLYGKRDSKEWDLFFNLLIDFNKQWCKNAAVLAVAISRNTFEHNNKPSRTHSYDTGAAWMCLSIEGQSRDLVIHGMEGFDYDKARKDLEIPEGYTVEAMLAIGKPGLKEDLPEDLRKRENPSPRKPLEQVAQQGKFKR